MIALINKSNEWITLDIQCSSAHFFFICSELLKFALCGEKYVSSLSCSHLKQITEIEMFN